MYALVQRALNGYKNKRKGNIKFGWYNTGGVGFGLREGFLRTGLFSGTASNVFTLSTFTAT